MATGTSGFGMTHGYHDGDEQPDRDISHEYKGGHGVSDDWIQKRVTQGARRVSTSRLRQFEKKMYRSGPGDTEPTNKHDRKKGLASYTASKALRDDGSGRKLSAAANRVTPGGGNRRPRVHKVKR